MKTYLTVPPKDSDLAEAIGALRDTQTGKLFVPPGAELAPFSAWLPAGHGTAALTIPGGRGVSLTDLLARVAGTIKNAFAEPIWVRIEISQLQMHSGHLYIVAVERNEDGKEHAKARAQIWANRAAKILRKFADETGIELAAGIKLLACVKPVFKPDAAPKNEFDPITKLPIDLLPLRGLGLTVPTIFRLMREASTAGKRLSDVFAYRAPRIATLGLTGKNLYAYLLDLIGEDVDFAFVAKKSRTEQAEAEELTEAKNVLQRLRRTCDGLEVRKNGEYIGVFRVAANPDDCDYIETSDSLVPVNLRAAKAILRGAFSFVSSGDMVTRYA